MKKEKRDDILTQTEEAAGIPIWEIMNAMRQAMHLSFYDFDREMVAYEQKGLISQRARAFAVFLLRTWKDR